MIGHTLNKCCSTGDGKWAYGWDELPEFLQLYGIADIMFGHMCYNILSTILLRDVFPDPEITCKFFNVPDQWFAVAYQGLRMIYRRIFNKEAVRIKELDDSFIDNIANQLVDEEERARKSLELYRIRRLPASSLMCQISGLQWLGLMS